MLGQRSAAQRIVGARSRCSSPVGFRWLWLQRTEDDRAWTALPIKIEPGVQALFNASVTVVVGNGSRTLFWRDNWINRRSVYGWAFGLPENLGSGISGFQKCYLKLAEKKKNPKIQVPENSGSGSDLHELPEIHPPLLAGLR